MAYGCSLGHKIISQLLIAFYYIKVAIPLYLYTFFNPKSKNIKERSVPPKCLMDPKYGTHKYAKINDIKLHYVENGDCQKPLMVFVHGFPEFWYSWRYQMEEFSNDYWCVALDLRGFGDSDKPTELGSYIRSNMVEDIKEFVKYLGREKFHLVAHDWGMVITMDFVHKYGFMLEDYIVMSGISCNVWGNLVWSDWEQFTNSWYIFFFQLPYFPELLMALNDLEFISTEFTRFNADSKITAEDIEAFKYTFSRKDDLKYAVNYYRDNFLRPSPPPIKNAHLRGLFIIGEKDPYVSKKCGTMVQDEYQNLEFRVLQNGGHFIQQEKPVEVNNMIKDFLSKTHPENNGCITSNNFENNNKNGK